AIAVQTHESIPPLRSTTAFDVCELSSISTHYNSTHQSRLSHRSTSKLAENPVSAPSKGFMRKLRSLTRKINNLNLLLDFFNFMFHNPCVLGYRHGHFQSPLP